jgi:hypothetical protein
MKSDDVPPPRRGPSSGTAAMSLNSLLDASSNFWMPSSPLLAPYANGNSTPPQGPSISREQFIALIQSALALVEDDDLFGGDDDDTSSEDDFTDKSH